MPLVAETDFTIKKHDYPFAEHHRLDSRDLPKYHDPAYPDALDFVLQAVYNNATEFDADAARTKSQNQSSKEFNKCNCRKIETATTATPKSLTTGHVHLYMQHNNIRGAGPIRVAEMVQRNHENQYKCYTDSIHASQTNNGYSRQSGGGFFRWS
ncbi:uncharacterized protein LOC129581057 [Paramacrobiotus metropolitanus]|uniref:uncharacterized protein LOC129581057 n=1 Tax=Paramacrobiotus metropolitanus TaxID=2943436 RepID=UPI0024461FF2|nr:uncharacterized protein LOC129581057 [Paramacrobiotus metropolitanus]